MRIEKIKNRSTVFTYHNDSWDLNLHLIRGNQYNYIIDTGLGSLSVEPIKEYIKDDSKPIIVINTHYHWDHIWGNGEFKDNIIIAHRLCRDIIIKKWDDMINTNEEFINGAVEYCLPNLVFDKELYFPRDKIRVIYTPGHTIDSISVIDEEEKVLNLGDNIGDTLEEIIPSIDGDKNQYITTLHRYLELDFDTCISGHNIVLKKDIIDTIISTVSK